MIEIQSLVKSFGSFHALDGISFQIARGSVFGLVGSNGAGKSTLLRTLAGVYEPDGGVVTIDGAPPFENSALKGRLIFISDYPYFLPQTTLLDSAMLYRSLYPNWDEQTFSKLCSMFPIDATQKIHNMSKGMQRQAALILGLSTCPEYLFLDEIFDGLDPVMRQMLKQLVSGEVVNRNMTVVVASHNLRELEDFCDHIGLMHRGGILFESEIDERKLGIYKLQAIFRPMPDMKAFDTLQIVKLEIRGSLISLVVRGNKEEILAQIDALHPVFSEIIPLTLEEVFISEMEVAGYDLNNILP